MTVKKLKKRVRPRCFFDVAIDGAPAGRIVMELFSDVTPKTCENFRCLCTGEKGRSESTGKFIHFKNSPFHRIVKNFMVQGGDTTVGNGTGGESIYGATFEDENFVLKHDTPHLLSMANRGKNTNGSQFFITTRPSPHLDGIHVVFGRLVSGQSVVTEIEAQKCDAKSNRPVADVTIMNCGELVLKKKSKKKDSSSDESSSSSSASSDEEKKSEKQKSKKKSEKKEKDAEKEAEEIVEVPTEPTSSVTAEEVPEVPSNNFLMRRVKTPEKTIDTTTKESDEKKHRDNRTSRQDDNRRDGRRQRRIMVSRSGHKIRGRGTLRYRTPSPDSSDRSGSRTPPHWRREQRRIRPLVPKAESERTDEPEKEERKRRRHSRSKSPEVRNRMRSSDNRGARRRDDTTGENRDRRRKSKSRSPNRNDDKRSTKRRYRSRTRSPTSKKRVVEVVPDEQIELKSKTSDLPKESDVQLDP